MKRIMSIVHHPKELEKVSKQAYKDLYINWDERIKEVYHRYLELIDNNK